MFVFELLTKNRRKKIEEWRKDGEAWIKKRNELSGYSVYTFENYEAHFPMPVTNYKKISAVVLPILAVIAVVVCLIGYVVTLPPKKVDPKNPNGCAVLVAKGDKVGVLGGDFDGSKGTVIDQRSDCSVHLTLDVSTYTFEKCEKVNKEYCNSTKENGAILKVNKSADIVKL